MIKINKLKLYNIFALILSVLVYLAVYIYWISYCVSGQCTYDFRNNFLRPISIGSLFTSAYFLALLLFPPQYFKAWFKYVFSWGLPLATYMTFITTGSSSIPAYGKVEVVKLWGVFFAVLTILFIGAMYWREKRKK